MNIFLLIFIGIGLSMDAFSLSLAYGTLGMSSNDKFLLSFITGLFHFFMPLLGLLIGNLLFSFFLFDSRIVVSIIFFSIGFQMFFSSFKGNDEIKIMNYFDYVLFALAVSIDSFSIGISFTNFDNIVLLSPFIFFSCSFIFTFIGLLIGNKIEKLLGKFATFLGGLIIILIGLKFLILK